MTHMHANARIDTAIRRQRRRSGVMFVLACIGAVSLVVGPAMIAAWGLS